MVKRGEREESVNVKMLTPDEESAQNEQGPEKERAGTL